MWLINCALLMIGTLCGIVGINFFVRNREAAGNIRFYILSYGICSSIWSIFYGLIGFCNDFTICEFMRKIGVAAIDAFIITEVFLASEMSGIEKNKKTAVRIFAVLISIVDFFLLGHDNINLYVREDGWTTWLANPLAKFYKTAHFAYMSLFFLILFIIGIEWVINNKSKRLRKFLFMVFVSNFCLIFFSIADTILPSFGMQAIPTSGFGGAACTLVMWYGATQLYSFDIRVGNVRDKLLDFIEAGVVVLDMNQDIAMMNRYSRNLEGWKEGQGNKLHDLFELDEATEKEMFLNADENIYSERLWDKKRSKVYALRLSAVKDNYGETFCYLCVFVDVTEEMEAISRFEIASQATSRFLAQMSHEIRTPINAVLGMNEMILRESKDEGIIEYAENINSAGNTLLALINSILDFSKIEDGKMDIIPVQYDTASFINDLVNSISQRAEAKGLNFLLEVDAALPCELIGDDVRFSQVVMNLLTNAVKYTEKGSVSLTFRTAKKDRESVEIFVSVKDTGIGIREEDKGRLFESFERLDEQKNHNIEGTGLGMSIVTSLLEMMGSRLYLESTYGEGSVFSFTIEQKIANPEPIGDYEKRFKEGSRHRKEDNLISAPGAKILVVDDNNMNLKVAKNLLKLCHIKPDMVSSGEEAIEYVRNHTYDIVFLDHMMPGLDGLETLARLKKEKLIPESTAMIALTANAVVGAKENYLAAGFRDYLSKPIEMKELVEKLKTYLPEGAYDTGEADHAQEEEKQAVDLQSYHSEAEVMEFMPEGEAGVVDFSSDAVQAVDQYDKEQLAAEGIDLESGLSYCADDENLYYEMLHEFVTAREEKEESIDRFFQEKNWHEYEIKVHALKSNAKTIGANSLSEQAKALEEAAKNGEISFIEKNHDELLRGYRQIADAIGKSTLPKKSEAE